MWSSWAKYRFITLILYKVCYTIAMNQSDLPLSKFFKTIGGWLRPYRSALAVAGVGFLLGILWLVGMRFLTVTPTETHYHANFAVYINGTREEFKSFAYY